MAEEDVSTHTHTHTDYKMRKTSRVPFIESDTCMPMKILPYAAGMTCKNNSYLVTPPTAHEKLL